MELLVDIKKKLHDFSLDVKFEAGTEALGLLGASGTGKSMTLRCIAGLEKPDKGRIVLNGRVLFDSEKNIDIPCRRRKIGFLFQNYALFPNMTVEQNIGFALEGSDKSKKDNIVQQMIGIIKLEGMGKRYPSQLSGGQQQRVALARALAIEPEALLLDEPFSALDNHLRNHMIKQLMDILSNYHGVTLFVTHNMKEAYRVCKKLVVLQGGSVEAQGDKGKLFQAPPTLAAAQLTGCRNFSAANYVGQHELEAAEWGIRLKTKNCITRDIKYVALRPHHIRMEEENDSDNLFKCWPVFTSETPFGMTVYVSVQKKPVHTDDYQLQWEFPMEEWYELQKRPLPWSICINPDKLIVLYK